MDLRRTAANFAIIWIFVCACAVVATGPAAAQGTLGGAPGTLRAPGGLDVTPPDVIDHPGQSAGVDPSVVESQGEMVVEVQVVGPKTLVREKVLPLIKTRSGRPFDVDLLEDDVRRLNRSGLFIDVKTYTQRVEGGRVVVFELFERPLLHYVKYVGNKAVNDKRLARESQLKPGEPLDTWGVEEAKRRLQAFYQSHGFPDARVTILEGNDSQDAGAVFLINEGCKQRVGWTQFVGNTVASDSRLRTQVETKPGIFWFIQGYLDREQLDGDVERLTAYYRKLGYFQAKVGRDLEFYPDPFNSNRQWALVTFVIDEGVRYQIRNIRFFGNEKFAAEELRDAIEVEPGDYFHQDTVASAVRALQDKYGAHGYVFADVQVDPRFREEPGELDLVFNLDEGRQYRVGRVNVHIKGEFPHTRVTTVLNRMSLVPGDIADVREMRASEVRLRRSQLFEVDPARGVQPKISYSPPELEDLQEEPAQVAERPRHPPPSDFRGQAPDDRYRVRKPGSPSPNDSSGGPSERIVRGQYTAQAGASLPVPPWMQPTPNRQASPEPPRYPATTQSNTRNRSEPGLVSGGVVPATGDYVRQPAAGTGVRQTAAVQGEQPPYMGNVSPNTRIPPATGEFQGEFFPGEYAPDSAAPLLDPSGAPPPLDLPLNAQVQEARTGRLMFSVGVNSDSGLVGTVLIEEQNFDITRWPRSMREIIDGVAWRGDGQRLRIEAVPGTELQRYMATFQEPYLFDRNVSLGVSGYYYDRVYNEWFEQRLGGRLSLGYQFTHDLSGTVAYRGNNIKISDPIETPWGVPPDIQEAVGDNSLHGFELALSHDTRDSTFLPTEGHLFQASFEQVVGSFQYPRADISLKRYFMLRQRPDTSGRHVLSLGGRFAVTGGDTPVYDRYYAGGFTSLRGFRYRQASPRQYGEVVGGETMLLASAEYMFPITADDLVRGMIFCDTGTVQPSIDDWSDNYRVAPGFGLRVVIPAMGPAPIALDFAFPISEAPGDENQVFSFFVGFLR